MVESHIIPNDLSWPCIMKRSLIGQNIIVLFSSPRCGTVIKSNDENFPVGYYWDEWNMDKFVPLNCSVVLRNA